MTHNQTEAPVGQLSTLGEVLHKACEAPFARLAELESNAAARAGRGQPIRAVIREFTEGLQRRIAALEAAEAA